MLRQIGSGGMGLVYAAEHRAGWPAAVKVLNSGATPDFVERFKREARIEIVHPNVVRRLDSGRDERGQLYIAFELLEGMSLADRIRTDTLPVHEAIDLGVQVCRGLGAAHAVGVVHRDLKPENIFLCRDGTVKILDFGIARIADAASQLTRVGTIMGTPAYLAPEQVHGRSDVDHRADLWALGVVLYETLAGHLPFRRPTQLAMMLAIASEPAEPLAGPPIELVRAIDRAMQKAKSDRWPDAASFRAALEAVDLSRVGRAPSAVVASPVRAEQRLVAVLLAEGVVDARAIRNAVVDHRGQFFRMIGERAIGLFGGERWEGDEIKRAASAALAIRGAAARIAVASGRAHVSEHGVAGTALKRAEAVCLAAAAEIGVEQETAAALGEGFVLQSTATGEVHALSGPRVPKKAPPTLRPPRHLFGRDVELATIKELSERAVDEHRASVLLFTGAPGAGKTVLREEAERIFAHACVRAGESAFILVGRAESHRRDSALALIASAFVSFAKESPLTGEGASLEADAPLEERRRAVLRLAEDAFENADDLEEHAPFLGELLGVRMPDSVALDAARGDPRLMADRVLLALKDYFAALSQRGAVALMLEDLQWADGESLDFVESIADRLSNERLFVLATANPDFAAERPEALAGDAVVRRELAGLDVKQVEELASMLVGKLLPAALVRAIALRTAGNPMFVRQIVLALADAKQLESASIAELPLPMSVEAALQSRLDHLTPDEKEMCKHAAVLGRSFSANELTALGLRHAKRTLESLSRRDLIVPMPRGDSRREEGYRFASPLVADVAYRLLTREVREALHARAGELMREAKKPAEEIAAHFERGGRGVLAARYHARASFAALRRGDMKSAVAMSERALSGKLPPYVEVALRLGRYDAYQFLGRRNEMGIELDRAMPFATTAAQKARVLAEKSWWSLRTGKANDALDYAGGAVELARGVNDRSVLVRALGRWISALIQVGRFDEAGAALDEALASTAGAPVQIRAQAESWRAHLASGRGDHGARREAFWFAASLYRQSGDLRRAAGASVNLADAYNRFGAYAEAELALSAALEDCKRIGHRQMMAYAYLNRGYALAMLGRIDESLESLDAAAKLARELREARVVLFERVYRARALLMRGDPGPAEALAEEAAGEADRAGHPAIMVTAAVTAARAKLELGDAAGAERLVARALEVRDELGGVEEDEAEVFVTYARALEATGRAEEAERILARGRARLQEIANGIAEPEWRARFERGIEAHRMLLGAS